MKTREEQIVEMAKEMRNYGYKHLCAGRVFYYGFCEKLYAAGYRKQSDTVREILRMIKDKGLFRYGGYLLHDSDFDTIGKLYGAEVEE